MDFMLATTTAATTAPRDSANKLRKMISCQKSLLAQVKSGKLGLPDGGVKIVSKLEELEASLARLQSHPEANDSSPSRALRASRTNVPVENRRVVPPASRGKELFHTFDANKAGATTGQIVEREVPLPDAQGDLAPSSSGQDERSSDVAMAEAAADGPAVSNHRGGKEPLQVETEAMAEDSSEGGREGALRVDEAMADVSGRRRLQQEPACSTGASSLMTGGDVSVSDDVAASDDVAMAEDLRGRAEARARIAERGQAATERAMTQFVRVFEKVQVRAGSIEPVGGGLRPGALQEIKEKIMQEKGYQVDRVAERLSSTLRIEDESMEAGPSSGSGEGGEGQRRRSNLAGTVQESLLRNGTRSVSLISISEAGNLLRAHGEEEKRIENEILERSRVARQQHFLPRGGERDESEEDDYGEDDEDSDAVSSEEEDC